MHVNTQHLNLNIDKHFSPTPVSSGKGTATRCNTLQHAATHSNTLQHNATHCNTLQHTATHCTTLQHTATYCNALQHTVTHCNTLQHTAAHSSILIQCKGAWLGLFRKKIFFWLFWGFSQRMKNTWLKLIREPPKYPSGSRLKTGGARLLGCRAPKLNIVTVLP